MSKITKPLREEHNNYSYVSAMELNHLSQLQEIIR